MNIETFFTICFLRGTFLPWLAGMVTSVLCSLIVVLILFVALRPRFEIKKNYTIEEDGKLSFSFRNKSIFGCVNVQVYLKNVLVEDNGDEVEENIELEDVSALHMSGYWSKSQDKELSVNTNMALKEIPKHMRLIVSAQHSVSNIISSTSCDFFS